ncbi:hypothetical protein F4553_003719 [Allocatelliglobosispora scoriae]|uniref:Uncharacterized protein n=1 Tax=Allocatelliglobosispora scoriae TaxID=643052 RepID=A0A841BU93_9ACTN|nr:hypothetical protein [Allocatelliglobosispora scoriae]MBB5870340.1 hypothetical protein [Allocatelliglobosispora scoriae]
MQEETTPELNRRRLLRRAGTVAAGLGAAGVVTAVNAAPAAAAGSLGPTIITGTASETALVVTSPDGPALRIAPSPNSSLTSAEDVGSVVVDKYGDVSTVGFADGVSGAKQVNMLYSPTWATMVVPMQSYRYFDSYFTVAHGATPANPDFVARLASGNVTSSPGNAIPVAGNNPSLVIDLSEIFTLNYGVMAVQANLTVVGAAAGYAALWGEGDDWPGNSSINYVKGVGIANFTQTTIDYERLLRVKVTGTARVIIDIVGFVVSDYYSQFNDEFVSTGMKAKGVKGAKGAHGLQPRRPAPTR